MDTVYVLKSSAIDGFKFKCYLKKKMMKTVNEE